MTNDDINKFGLEFMSIYLCTNIPIYIGNVRGFPERWNMIAFDTCSPVQFVHFRVQIIRDKNQDGQTKKQIDRERKRKIGEYEKDIQL